MAAKPTISLVIPVYNEAANLEGVYSRLRTYLEAQPWHYEIIFVNDGSRDRSLELIRDFAKANPLVRYIDFSRNFGKEAATTAGIRAAKGDAVVMMDADGQNPHELLEKFVAAWQAGAYVVVGMRRSNQGEGFIKRYGSKLFYWVLNIMTDGNSKAGSTDFRLIDRRVADEFVALTEHNRITRGLIDWLGFERAYVDFHAPARGDGRAGYTYRKLVKLALHGFVSQSTVPLMATGVLGLIVMVLSALLGVFMVIEKFALGDPLSLGITGTAFLAVFLSFLVGIVLGCQGLLALYIESIHNETQNRPLYIVREEG